MAPPTITKKFLYGFDLDIDGSANVGKTVTATISREIRRAGEAIYLEKDAVVSSPVDGDGRWVLALHPNNQPGDNPLNTFWTLTYSDGTSDILFIPYNASGGTSSANAINYLTFVTAVANLPAPSDPSNLDARISYLESVIPLMNTLDSAGLAGLTPAQDTSLVDAALASSVDATPGGHGLMPQADKVKLDSINDALITYYDAQGAIKIKTNSGPVVTPAGEGRLWVGQLDAQLKASIATAQTSLAPAFDAPAAQLSSDFALTTDNNWVTISTIPVVANALYYIAGPLAYIAQGNYFIGIRFTAIPTAATIRWSGVGLASATVAGAGGVGSIDTNLQTATNELQFPGQGTTGVGNAIFVSGTLRTSTTGGTLNLQARRVVRSTAGTINPLILAGSSIFFTRVL